MFPSFCVVGTILMHVMAEENCDYEAALDRLNVMIATNVWGFRSRRQGNRRAMRLLRSLLTAGQRAELRRRWSFTITAPSGSRYRLWPYTGTTERIERHGKYEIGKVQFCLHEPENELPPADRAIAHLLMILADEPRFLAEANHHERTHMGWDGAWHRRLHAARIERDHAAP